MSDPSFLQRISDVVAAYRARVAGPFEHLSLLRWQISEGHALERRETCPGHVTTSAFIFSPDMQQTLLINHLTLQRWLQPGGHFEPAAFFWQSARREAIEETGIASLALHPWHAGEDLPFVIDSHDVPGKASRGEVPHVHHDLQYLFVADPAGALTAQLEEVSAVAWVPFEHLSAFAPKVLERLPMVR